MRFSANGYYIERYVKCANCGVLIYDEGIAGERHGKACVYCSPWCVDWAGLRDREEGYFRLPIVQPKLPLEAAHRKLPQRTEPPDMVLMKILDSTMVSICREMGILLMKTSYSTIFNEGLDFTCALADDKGDMIACAEFCPTMIGGMPLLIKTCAQEIPFDTIADGDVILHNDPYRGGLHCPEHTFFKPFFVDGELKGFAVCIGHIAEIGGMVPGAFCGEATEIFHEGLRVPPVKIKKAGKDVDEVWKLLLANCRTPRQNYGDLRAMIGAVDLGVKRITEIIKKYGSAVFTRTCEDLMDYAERRMRAELTSFPDGKYGFEDVIENDGIEARPYTVAIDLYIQGDEVVADYSRSSPQAKGPINATLGVATGAVYNGLLHVTDPSIPKNSGCFRPIRVVAPPGHVINVDYPGPLVAGNTETHPRLANITIGAIGQCAPERAMASESCTGTNFVFGGNHPDHDEYFACYDLMSGGWGGRFGHDGNDCVIAINGNCRFNPTEVFETRFPLLVEDCAMITDSGGAGRWRGGLGYTRTLKVTSVPITGSQCSDRHEVRPFALVGGQEGGNGGTQIEKAGSDEWLTVRDLYGKVSSSKYANAQFQPGDRIRLWTPGGGGYGDPRERDPALIEEDLEEGYISPESARQNYGYTRSHGGRSG
jgi:N-methylhydantoinase B